MLECNTPNFKVLFPLNIASLIVVPSTYFTLSIVNSLIPEILPEFTLSLRFSESDPS